jgi:hypothetical protein
MLGKYRVVEVHTRYESGDSINTRSWNPEWLVPAVWLARNSGQVKGYVLVEGIKTRVTERESWPTNRVFLEPVVSEGLSGLPPLESCHNSIHKSSYRIHTCNLRNCSIGRTLVPLLRWLLRYLRYQGPLTSLWLVIVVSTIPRNGGVHGALRRRCASAGAATQALCERGWSCTRKGR